MSLPREPSEELEQLLQEVVDGELNYVQQQHLAALLHGDTKLQQQYRDYLLLDALLRWELPEATVSPAASNPWRWHSRLQIAAALVAGLLLVIGGYLLHSWQQRNAVLRPDADPFASDDGDGEPGSSGLAVLTRSAQAQWSADCPPLSLGSMVSAGPLKLKSGLVQLEFYSGAHIVIQGPADLELQAKDRLCCRSGRLRVSVPRQAQGFTILSATAKLIDLGTEFGVEVAAGGATEVHVFDGKVEVYDPRTDGAAQPKQELTAGHGVKVEENGRRIDIQANARRFATPDEVARGTAQDAAQRLEQWRQTREAFRRDPRLVVYYPFLRHDPSDRALTADNDASGSLNGAIIGCEWAGGRRGKQALEFKHPGDRVRVTVPGEFDALTWMAWVRVDALEHRYNALFLTDSFEVGVPHWQITDNGRMRLCVATGPVGTSRRWRTYDSEVVLGPEQLGQWKHLATVYDRARGLVRHYVNGRPVGGGTLVADLRLAIGRAEIGNWGAPFAGDRYPIRNLVGRIDEFWLFRAALSTAEIQDLYDVSKPVF